MDKLTIWQASMFLIRGHLNCSESPNSCLWGQLPFFQDALYMYRKVRFTRIVKRYDLLLGQPKVSVDQLDFDLCSVRFGVINDDMYQERINHMVAEGDFSR